MTKRIEIIEAVKQENKILLKVDQVHHSNLDGAQSTGRMLVDSDGLAFIYILEDEHGFIYTSLTRNTWSALKIALDEQLSVLIENPTGTIELENINDELHYLISNINGNANYGNEMVKEVEEIFLHQKAKRN
jgi:hypothetical protein